MKPHPILHRDFLSSLSGGFTGLALTHLLAREAAADAPLPRPELNGGIHHRAKVKRVIQLFMNGGVSPMDTWDFKLVITWSGPWQVAKRELFDLSRDIGETSNLAEKMPGKADEMSAALIAYLKSVNAETALPATPKKK